MKKNFFVPHKKQEIKTFYSFCLYILVHMPEKDANYLYLSCMINSIIAEKTKEHDWFSMPGLWVYTIFFCVPGHEFVLRVSQRCK